MEVLKYKFESSTCKHKGGREEQQDSVAIIDPSNKSDIQGVCFAVLGDGMGGHKGGSIASKSLIYSARVLFENNTKNRKDFFNNIILDTERFFNKITSFTEQRLAKEVSKYETYIDPRTTSALALVFRNRVYYGNIGDSRVYIFKNGKFVDRTKDHSVTEMLYQMKEITEEEMATHPDQNKLLKSISSKGKESITFYKESFNKDDELDIILCSDGLWEYLPKERMESMISRNMSADELTNLMVDTAYKEGKKANNNIRDIDNISIALIKVRPKRVERAKKNKININKNLSKDINYDAKEQSNLNIKRDTSKKLSVTKAIGWLRVNILNIITIVLLLLILVVLIVSLAQQQIQQQVQQDSNKGFLAGVTPEK